MVRVGLIGCGSITKYRHAPEYKLNKDSEIAGFFDVREERAKELYEGFGGNIYKTLEDMLRDKNIDAVSVCTPNKYHATVTINALNAGKHVLCEKPMATSLEDAKKMIEAADSNKKIIMIGHNQRLALAHAKAKQIIESGEIGSLLTFTTCFGHGGPENWSADKGKGTWFFNKDNAFVGAMGDLWVHKADLIRWLTGDEVEEVKAYVSTLDKKINEKDLIEVDDNAVCLVKFREGTIGTLTASWTYYGNEDNSTVLYCTKGIVEIYKNKEFPLIVSKSNGEKIFYKLDGIQTNDNQTNSGVIDMFIESIVQKKTPGITGKDGMEALRIILACMESSETGKSVKL